jgi:D-alanyl-D-alanine carboxypeptidase (penicillin-binding protein 5/6)
MSRGARIRLVGATIASLVVILVGLALEHGSTPPPPAGGSRPGSLSADPGSSRVPPALELALAAPARTVVPGRLPKFPWPATGEAAIGVQGTGILAATARQSTVPIASVTKVMTAFLVLQDHPLAGPAGGPELTMTEADALAYQHDAGSNDSSLLVVKGEVLDERQLLEGLLIPSADNVADLLAKWDAGSIPAFVAKMNAEAKALGMTGTHYADASGLDPHSRSTAEDQVRLASAAMAIPAFASLVDHTFVRIPIAGAVWNYNPLIGVDGVVGVKSGFTNAAKACLVVAAWREVDGRRVLLVAAAIGQPLGLYQAADVDRALLDVATPLLRVRQVFAGGDDVAEARVPWSARVVGAMSSAAASVVVWPGASLDLSLQLPSGKTSWVARDGVVQGAGASWYLPAAGQVGEVVVSVAGSTITAVPLRLQSEVEGPPPGWSGSAASSG